MIFDAESACDVKDSQLLIKAGFLKKIDTYNFWNRNREPKKGVEKWNVGNHLKRASALAKFGADRSQPRGKRPFDFSKSFWNSDMCGALLKAVSNYVSKKTLVKSRHIVIRTELTALLL